MNELRYQIRWALPIWLIGLCTNWLPVNRITLRLRGALMSAFIYKCGRNFLVGPNVTLRETNQLIVGNDVYIAHGCWLDAIAGLELEDEVVLAPYVVIPTAQHVFQNGSVRFGGNVARPVVVGYGSWIATHVTIRCGVTIGKSVLVAANSFVSQDIPDKVIVGGVPAKFIKPNEDGVAEFVTRQDFERLNAGETGE